MGTNVWVMRDSKSIDGAVLRFLESLNEKNASKKNQVEESSAFYGVTYKSFLKNKMLVAQSIQHGLPQYLFEEIQHQTSFTEEDWADFLNVSTKSLQRYKADKSYVFKPIHSEKILEVAEVTELGKEVFDDSEKFHQWLGIPNVALAGYKPSELIKSSYGKELVMDELIHIDQGIFV